MLHCLRHACCALSGAAPPWLRFKKVLIPALRRHYRGRKKFTVCFDGCKSMNNQDLARRGG